MSLQWVCNAKVVGKSMATKGIKNTYHCEKQVQNLKMETQQE
jgi:hypothetical protein